MEMAKLLVVELLQGAVWAIPLGWLAGYLWITVLQQNPLQGFGIAIVVAGIVLGWRLQRIRCCGCGKFLNRHIVLWQEDLSAEERLNIESYVESSKLFQCRRCRRLQCLDCAMAAKLHCRKCQELSLRTGYFAA